MARARNIKPSFFTNEKLAECEPFARLLFAGLWTLADREGRLNDIPIRIKAQVLPYDTCDCNNLLSQLHDKKLILRYTTSGSDEGKYIQILSFTKHQQPHYKEIASVIPAPNNWTDSGVTPGGVPESVRKRILERDGKCQKCGTTKDLTVDHKIPRSLGGTHEEKNLQAMCRPCNSSKNNRLVSLGQDQANVDPTKALDDSLNPLSLIPITESLLLNPLSLKPGSGAVVKIPYPSAFEDFWEVYPANAASKKKTYESWSKINATSHVNVTGAAANYSRYIELTGGIVAHATTWLNQERYDIDYEKLLTSGRNNRPVGKNLSGTSGVFGNNAENRTIDATRDAAISKIYARAKTIDGGAIAGSAGEGDKNPELLLENPATIRQEK